MSSNIKNRIFLTLLATSFLATSALAVKPGAWTHQTEADFSKADADHALITNLGEIKLARADQKTAELEGDDSIVYDIVRLGDKRVFLAIGPEGRLAEYLDGEVKNIHTFEGEQIFALASAGKRLWVAVSGANSRIELRGGEDMSVRRTIELPDTRYVWDIVVSKKMLFLATGTEGRVVAIDTDQDEPKPVVALQTKQENVLCLDIDKQGRLYAGTDGEGLVYRITPTDAGYSTFVLYDAAEPEIGAILVANDGNVYAGTADAKQARPGRLEKARTEPRGRPERPSPSATIPNQAPKPKPNAKDEAAEDSTTETAKAEKAPVEANPKAEEVAETKKADDSEAVVAEASVAPTTEQYDELRQAISQRLDEARDSGPITLQASPSRPSSRPSSSGQTASRASSTRRPGSAPAKAGNAIYQINPEGFVHEVFRESVMILRLAKAGQSLLVTTGNEGQVFRVNPELEEVTILADLDSQQVPALLNLGEGNILLGAANPGLLTTLDSSYAAEGSITSEPLDAKQISLWGKFQITARTPEGSSVQLQTRSGNVADPEAGSWSDWSDSIDVKIAAGSSDYLNVASPTARFLQYRLLLNSDGQTTPTVQRISLKYLMPNLRPSISEIKTTYVVPRGRPTSPSSSSSSSSANAPTAPQPLTSLKVEWKATDLNKDKLTYTLQARSGQGPFITLVEDLATTSYEWKTHTTPDGRYTLRVIASDAADNVPSQALTSTRRSDPVVVDNTAPRFEKLTVTSNKKATNLSGSITDSLTPLTEIRYNIDSSKDWQIVLPKDFIYDSTNESFSVKLTDLAPGPHVVTVRATDTQGNSRYTARNFTVK